MGSELFQCRIPGFAQITGPFWLFGKLRRFAEPPQAVKWYGSHNFLRYALQIPGDRRENGGLKELQALLIVLERPKKKTDIDNY